MSSWDFHVIAWMFTVGTKLSQYPLSSRANLLNCNSDHIIDFCSAHTVGGENRSNDLHYSETIKVRHPNTFVLHLISKFVDGCSF